MKIFLLIMAFVYCIVGIFGIIDGIIDVMQDRYADNIFLGALIAILFPAVCLFAYLELEKLEHKY